MYFKPSTFVVGISFWVFGSGVQAQYSNATTPLSNSTSTTEVPTSTSSDLVNFSTSASSSSSITTDPPTSSPAELPNLSTLPPPTSIPNLSTYPSNLTIQDTTTSTPLPTSTSALLNATYSYVYPNATTSSQESNTTSTISQAFNTSTPTGQWTNSTATQSSWFTQAQNTTRPTGPTPAPVKLSPALPPTLDPHDPVILQPNRSINLYFQGAAPPQNSSQIPMASVDIPKMAYPAVVLDHSALIDDIECDLTKLRMKFLHRSALDVAESSWTMPKFVMLAFHKKCGRASKTGERDYLLVRGLKFNREKLSVSADIKHIGIVEAVGKENPITVDMGTYTPTGSLNGTSGFNSDNDQTRLRNGTVTKSGSGRNVADFDVALDDKIGYTTVTTTSKVKRFSGLDIDNDPLLLRRWSCGWCKSVVNAVKSVVKTVTSWIPSYTLTPLNTNINLGTGNGNVATPWGKNGYQIYSKYSGSNYLRLYCVDCGLSGVVNIKATVSFNLIGVITSGSFGVNGWMSAGLGLGVDANYITSIPAFSKTLFVIPLSPFSIPGLITIGPQLSFGVGAAANVNARGNMYAGLRLNWNAIHTQLNLYSAPSASGWTPVVVPSFQAAGTLQMSANIYALVSLGFGVSIINGLKSFGVALVEKPELYLGGTSQSPSCSGLQLSAGLRNNVYADVFGSHHNIMTWNGPSTSKCIPIKKKREVLSLPAPAYALEKRGEARQIKTADGAIGLHYADNGNIYALPQGNGSLVDMSTISFSATNDGILTGDVESRIFHGYTDTLSHVGVSRLRLSRPDHIPSTAIAITLQKSNGTETPDVLIALDAAHNIYYPIVCTFGEKDFPKMFLAKDPDQGATTLMSPDNVQSITGAKADACAFLPLIAV